MARTAAFDAAYAAGEGWTDDAFSLLRRLIAEVDSGAEAASAMLPDGHRVRVFPLLGLLATYAVCLERERSVMSVEAIAKRFPLSLRECEVIRLLMCGATNAEIAVALRIGETTVASHVRNIGVKLGCSKRSTMVARVLGFSEGSLGVRSFSR
ncbi:MAG: hypothetical protein NVS3B16_04740 [Vulcanimicrobiaceae bacterium]